MNSELQPGLSIRYSEQLFSLELVELAVFFLNIR